MNAELGYALAFTQLLLRAYLYVTYNLGCLFIIVIFIYLPSDVISQEKKVQLLLGLSAKHQNLQFLQNQHTNLQSQAIFSHLVRR